MSAGPAVVAIGGGHGLAATLRSVRRYAGSVTAVVSVADDGGSTGRLRAAKDQPAPGDLRKSLVALADPASPLAVALDHRYDGGELDGHAFGNLMILSMAEALGGLVPALDEIGRLTGAAGRVLPATCEAAHLSAESDGGVVEGQVEISLTPGIHTVAVDPHVVASPEAVAALEAADQIVLGPGSLFTSVLAAAVVPGIREAIERSNAALVYVCNLRPQLAETDGYDLGAHVDALARHGLVPDVVLVDPAMTAGGDTGDVDGIDGPVVLERPLANRSGFAHDPELLAGALAEVVEVRHR